MLVADPNIRSLENEAIHIFREVAAEFENPVLLYSVGKDSTVLLHLARKAFYPEPIPFPLVHIDTGWKFPEMIAFRDETVAKYGLNLISHTNLQGQKDGITPLTHDSSHYTDVMKTQALRAALEAGKYDAAFGGARRDEEASRSKERIYSFRSKNNKWDPRNQRPELWSTYNGRIKAGESIRAFPLSNWTELDIWKYIKAENLDIVPLYFAEKRKFVERNSLLILAEDPRLNLEPNEQIFEDYIRFRTLGCFPLTGAVRSHATTLDEIISELKSSTVSERQGRAIDHDTSGSMERKKRDGYF